MLCHLETQKEYDTIQDFKEKLAETDYGFCPRVTVSWEMKYEQ
jgi:hypothetical protein